MPFPRSNAAAGPATITAPAVAYPPGPQTAPTPPPLAPSAPMPPAASVAPEPKFWVNVVPGQPAQSMTLTQLLAQQPTTLACTEDQSSGWVGAAQLAARYPGAAAPAVPTPGAFAARAVVQTQANMGAGANLYAGVENATFFRKSSMVTEGEYVCRLTSAEYKMGRAKNMVICELEVITSSYDPAVPATHEAIREGAHMAVFIIKNDNFLSNIKEVVIAASGFKPDGTWRDAEDVVTAQECAALTSPEQAYAGAMVYLEARIVKTKAGGDFTRVNWWPMPMLADGKPDYEKARQVRA